MLQCWKNNLRLHYVSLHEDKYDKFQGQRRREKVNELLVGLKKQQSVFTHSRDISDAAVKASYLIANEMAVASKAFSEGEFVKTCMMKAAEIVCPEKRQASPVWKMCARPNMWQTWSGSKRK